ncbi:winged helix DNA-binding protein [Actinomadura soli]|uniref:Winged helix DNA-binding protein n=1 Tax=Actinomadura soli TaxID=2508997 RepID=A0A5C4J781_9ACTN|nr:winged helix DNA-binding protein [Actinomadura soli]
MLWSTGPTPMAERTNAALRSALIGCPTTSYSTSAARSKLSCTPPCVAIRTAAPRSRSARWISSIRVVSDRYPQLGSRQITAPASAIYWMTQSGNILHMDVPGKSVFDIGPDSDLEPAVRAFRVLLLVGQRLHRLMDQRLRADGLTTQQAALLTVVTALGRPSLGEAADAMGTTHQNAAQLVAALTRKEFLRVEPDPADRRRRRLIATETNDQYWRVRDAADHNAVADWFSTLTDSELQTLTTLSERLLKALSET